MDRIRGVAKVDPKSADFALNQGYLEVPELGRRKVDGVSVVGLVYSDRGQLKLDRSNGNASPNDGFGLLARQIVLLHAFAPAAEHAADFGDFGLELVQGGFIGQFLGQQGAQVELDDLGVGRGFDEVGAFVGGRGVFGHD